MYRYVFYFDLNLSRYQLIPIKGMVFIAFSPCWKTADINFCYLLEYFSFVIKIFFYSFIMANDIVIVKRTNVGTALLKYNLFSF